jgi:hypothetical protein
VFEQLDHPDGLPVMLEAANIGRQFVEGLFAGVPEGRMSEVVRQAYRFGEVDIQAKLFGDGPSG